MKIKKSILITLISSSILIVFLLIILVTNYTCIRKIHVENNYQKENGSLLLSGLASTFDAWGNNIDKSNSYFISKKCFESFGPLSSWSGNNLRKASKNNRILEGRILKLGKTRKIYINQCILLKDVKILYLAYNTFLSDTKNVFTIALYDNMNNIIAKAPSFTDIQTSWVLRNYENYFWGIDFDKYTSINLQIEVYSPEGKLIEAYDHLLF